MVQPAALGSGLPLFKDLPAPLHLELVEATAYSTGVAIHVYTARKIAGRAQNRPSTEEVPMNDVEQQTAHLRVARPPRGAATTISMMRGPVRSVRSPFGCEPAAQQAV